MRGNYGKEVTRKEKFLYLSRRPFILEEATTSQQREKHESKVKENRKKRAGQIRQSYLFQKLLPLKEGGKIEKLKRGH